MLTKSLLRAAASRKPLQAPCRLYTISCSLQSGHSKWSKIKHDKFKEDQKMSKERTILSANVARASRDGGPDPKMNPALAHAIATAKKGQLHKDGIAAAIARGQGVSLSGLPLENVVIEAMLPHGVATILEFQTENKNRILASTKSILKKAGGAVSPTAFLFERKGKLWFHAKEGVGVDEVLDEAIEAGAEEVYMEDGRLVVETSSDALTGVGDRLSASLDLQVQDMQILYDPNQETMVKLGEEQATEVQSVIDAIEELDDLQTMYNNISES